MRTVRAPERAPSGSGCSRFGFNWCLSTLGCSELEIDAALALAAGFGISSLELRALGGGLDLPGYFAEYARSEPEKFEALAASGRIVVIDTSFGLVENSAASREELLEFARLADRLGAGALRAFGGFALAEPFGASRLNGAVQTLRWWAACRERYDFKCELWLEVHDGFSSSDRCRKLREVSPVPLRFVWDVQHSHFTAGEALADTWENLGGAVAHVHLRDLRRTAPGQVQLVLPGEGEMPVGELCALLHHYGYAGRLSLEWEKHWHPELSALPIVLHAAQSAGWIA